MPLPSSAGNRDVRLEQSGTKPVRAPAVPRLLDFRTPEQRAEDKARTGAYWRCPTHGATQTPLLLGVVTYCPAEDCAERVLLVHTASREYAGYGEAWERSGKALERPAAEPEQVEPPVPETPVAVEQVETTPPAPPDLLEVSSVSAARGRHCFACARRSLARVVLIRAPEGDLALCLRCAEASGEPVLVAAAREPQAQEDR